MSDICKEGARDLVTIGESMVLLVPTRPGLLRHVHSFERFVAGAESNTAIGLTRLGHKTGWISRVGADEFGTCVKGAIRGEGVDTSLVKTDDEAPTAVYFKERRRPGETRVYYYRSDSAASRLAPEDLDPSYIQQARYLHLTGITPALSASCQETLQKAVEIAKEGNTIVSFDPNVRYKLWSAKKARQVLRALTAEVDILLASEEEAQLMTGTADMDEAAHQLREMGPEIVVIKLGAKGALALWNGHVVRQAPVSIDVVEQVGAGDAFNAGFLSGQLRQWDVEDCLQLGAITGALATTVPGDIEGIPTWEEVQPYLKNTRMIQR